MTPNMLMDEGLGSLNFERFAFTDVALWSMAEAMARCSVQLILVIQYLLTMACLMPSALE